ncbi:unnamed protein product [Blepharisma stoltei]|uniref:ISXO2-like transposase domain-containing protein n=1 Tax=Blepharisma stoltei TaxID=1481888 RepID=A0AAU9I961_9CILI|nr:unnamed protein product [Blepharisma stoltei]
MNATEVFIDGWAAYRQLPTLEYHHSIVFHNQDFGIGRQTTNRIGNIWSRLKRLKAYRNGFRPKNEKNLDNYCMFFYWLLKLKNIPERIDSLIQVFKYL